MDVIILLHRIEERVLLKSLLSIISLDRTATTVVSVLPKDKSTGNLFEYKCLLYLIKHKDLMLPILQSARMEAQLTPGRRDFR